MKFLIRAFLIWICVASAGMAWADDFSDAVEKMGRKRYEEAFVLFEKAAEAGNVEAEYFLGNLYATGRGVPQNLMIAALWYQKAAEQGNVKAQYMLGEAYEKGKGVHKNYAQAVIWYEKAAIQGLAIAQYNLALMYVDEGRDLPEDSEKAHYWFQKAAQQGHAKAYESLKKLEKKDRQLQRR